MRRALAMEERTYSTDHAKVAIRLNNLANLLQATKRLSEAEPMYRRALAIFEKSYGADHPVVANGLSNLGALLQATNRMVEGSELIRRSVAILDKFKMQTGYEHPYASSARANLAITHFKMAVRGCVLPVVIFAVLLWLSWHLFL